MLPTPGLAHWEVSRGVGARVKSREKETRCSPCWELPPGVHDKELPALGPPRQGSGKAQLKFAGSSCSWTFHSSYLVHLNLCKLNFRRLLLRSQETSLNCRME